MLTQGPLRAAALVLLLLAAACSKQTAPATAVPPGYSKISHNGAGVTIAVPSEFVQVPLPKNQNVARFNQIVLPMVDENPRLRHAINQARQVLQFGGKAFAVSTDGQTRVNITVDTTKEKTLDQLAQNVVPKLEQSGARDIAQERVTTGAGPALKLRFRFPIEGDGDEPVLADEVQYYVLHEKKSYVLTVINGGGNLADTVASSLRLR